MPAVPRANTSYFQSCCAPVYRLICLPCRIITAINDLAKRIFYYIRYGKSHPFATTEEEKEHFNELVKNLSRVDPIQRKPSAIILPSHSTWADAGKKMPLTDNTKHSRELTDFRILAKQIITALARKLVEIKEQVPTDEAERNDIISGVGMLCDKITERLAARLEEPQLATKLFDNIMTYANEDAKAHVAANQALPAKGKKTYQSELIDVQDKKKIVAEYHQNRVVQKEAAYKSARDSLLEKAKDGGELHCREYYYEVYTSTLDAVHDHNKAHEKALKAYEYQNELQSIYFAKYAEVLGAKFDCNLAHKEAMAAYEAQAALSKDSHVILKEDFHEKCLQIYLQHIYAITFSQQKVCSDDIKLLFETVEKQENDKKVSAVGDVEKKYRDHVRAIAKNIISRLMPFFVETIAIPLISTNFFKWILRTNTGIEIKEDWIKNIEKLLRVLTRDPERVTKLLTLIYPVEDKLISILEKWILSKELTHQFASNIYPAIHKQILKVQCRTAIQNNIKDYAFWLYANLANDSHADDIKKALWKEMTSDERQEFSLKGDNPPYSQEAFFEIVDELLISLQNEQFLARKVIRDLEPAVLEILTRNFHALALETQEANKENLRGQIKALITSASSKSYSKLVKPAEALPPADRKAITADQEKKYGNHLDPLVENIEMRLLDLKSKSPQPLVFEQISTCIKDAINDKPMDKTSFIGDLTYNIICDFATSNSWATLALNWLPGASNLVKDKINYHASTALEPFRSSFDELAKTVTETIESKLLTDDGTGLELDKVYAMYFGDGERKVNCDPELDQLAKQLFELVMQISGPKSWTNTFTKWKTGNDSKHIKEVLAKVHQTFFGIQMINLSRLDRVFKIVTTVLDESSQARQITQLPAKV